MREFNAIIYNAIKGDSTFKSSTGGTIADPRIYKNKTPIKITVTDAKPGYAVYYLMGTTHPSDDIHGATKNNLTYGIEIYGKRDVVVEEIAYRLEHLFEEVRLTTTSFVALYCYATRGSISFDEGRQLYTETLTLNLTHVLTFSEAS